MGYRASLTQDAFIEGLLSRLVVLERRDSRAAQGLTLVEIDEIVEDEFGLILARLGEVGPRRVADLLGERTATLARILVARAGLVTDDDTALDWARAALELLLEAKAAATAPVSIGELAELADIAGDRLGERHAALLRDLSGDVA